MTKKPTVKTVIVVSSINGCWIKLHPLTAQRTLRLNGEIGSRFPHRFRSVRHAKGVLMNRWGKDFRVKTKIYKDDDSFCSDLDDYNWLRTNNAFLDMLKLNNENVPY